MFAMSSNAFQDYSTSSAQPLSDNQLLERLKDIQDILFPAVANKLKTSQDRMKSKFDRTKNLLGNSYPDGSYVMKRDATRSSTLQPYYEGPFKILKQTSGGSYVLQDSTGSLLPRNAAPECCPFTTKNYQYSPDTSQSSFEIDTILDH
jgi:hypothetical protein